MAKYKVGDKVRVRSDLERYDSQGNIKNYYMEDGSSSNTVVPYMLELAGKIVTITRYDYNQYLVEKLDSGWKSETLCWTDEMFEGLAEETEETKFHVYDTVKHEKYGIGTVIEIKRISRKTGKRMLQVEFDNWNEDFPNYDETTIYLDSNELTVIKAYLPN